MDVKKLSFERAIEELELIVTRLEGGKVPLEESVAIYERGEALKRRCEELLRQAEARVDKITTDANGQVDRYRAARRSVIAFRTACQIKRLDSVASPASSSETLTDPTLTLPGRSRPVPLRERMARPEPALAIATGDAAIGEYGWKTAETAAAVAAGCRRSGQHGTIGEPPRLSLAGVPSRPACPLMASASWL